MGRLDRSQRGEIRILDDDPPANPYRRHPPPERTGWVWQVTIAPTPLREEDRPLGGVHVPARGLQRHEHRLEVGVQGNGVAPGLAFSGAVGYVEHLRDLPGRIGHHGPGQRGRFLKAEALSYESVWIPEHLAVPVSMQTP